MQDNYVVYHLHTDSSIGDSCTSYQDYVDKAKSLGQKAICFTEHGNMYNWIKKKQYCEEKGIKYIHGVEAYLTETLLEKIKDNYHTILIAKNYAGFLELNKLISKSFDDEHFYHKPRISFDEFLSLSKNVIKISACIASPLSKLDVTHPYYERLVRAYDYLEVQPHKDEEQKQYNLHLWQLSHEYKKPLIAATDTHSLNNYKAECRRMRLAAKNIFYNEDGFDLTYKSYEELIKSFKKQGVFSEEVYLSAIDNTNLLAESVETFELDRSFKYPILYGSYEKDEEIYYSTVDNLLSKKLYNGIIPEEQKDAFLSAIEEESRVFKKVNMLGFMLFMSELVRWCWKNSIPVGFNRGSVGGSRVAYVTDIIDLNPETWHTVFSRFCNEDREEIGDIDIDVSPDDREKVYQYIRDRFSYEKTAFILALGTVDSKGTIDEIGRSLHNIWMRENIPEEFNKNKDVIEEYKSKSPYRLSVIKEIKEEFAKNESNARAEHPEIFYYFDGLANTVVSQSMHPAGIVASPVTLRDNYCTFTDRSGNEILMIDMDCVHDVSLVKYDILGLKNIKIIKDTCTLADIPYPKSHQMDWYDKDVWKDLLKDKAGIFQFEGDFAFSLLCRYKPQSIFDMALVTAALRPSGASYRDELMDKIPHKNPSSLIDELLKNNNGYLIYQEDVIKFLTDICGFSGSEADNTRRAIGRKIESEVQKALPKILEGYCSKSSKPRDEAEDEAKEFLQIISDASSYMFGYNHSIGYCMISYICAYLRYYYPYEFITAYLNNAKDSSDISQGSEMAKVYGIAITSPRWEASSTQYAFNKDAKIISKGVTSSKYFIKDAAKDLIDISVRCQHYDAFYSVVDELYHSSLKTNQLEILIKIDYFQKFGNIRELTTIYDFFKNKMKFGAAKTISVKKLENMDKAVSDIIKKYSSNIRADGSEGTTYKILETDIIMSEYEDYVKSLHMSDLSIIQKIANHKEYMGYVGIVTNKKEDRRKLIINDTYPLGDWGHAVIVKSLGTGKEARLTVTNNVWNKKPLKEGVVVYANSLFKNYKGYWYMDDYSFIY